MNTKYVSNNEPDICSNKHGGVDTSQEAFEKAKFNRNKNHRKILETVRLYAHGLTTEEIEHLTGIQRSTCSARVSELKKHGFLIPSGRKKLTNAGNSSAHILILGPANEA